MLLMPVQPFEPNGSCYVCSEVKEIYILYIRVAFSMRLFYCVQTPLLLEINTCSLKLKDFVEKIINKKLGIISPIIMHGSTLIFEVGDDLEEDIAANYALNLEKVKLVN